MESSWGRNVVEFGLGQIGATRCSPLLAFPAYHLTNADVPGTPGFFQAWTALNPGEPRELDVFYLPKFTPHFPFGFVVQPDVPL